MAKLTKNSTIQEVAAEASELRGHSGRAVYKALKSTKNQMLLADHNIHNLGDLLTPHAERILFRLEGTGRPSITVLQSFLFGKGFTPEWPHTESKRTESGSRLSRSVDLAHALEEADEQYSTKTGKPVGEFSKKIKENTEAQEKGARLKGRRTL